VCRGVERVEDGEGDKMEKGIHRQRLILEIQQEKSELLCFTFVFFFWPCEKSFCFGFCS
jgi:hypothetical protein